MPMFIRGVAPTAGGGGGRALPVASPVSPMERCALECVFFTPCFRRLADESNVGFFRLALLHTVVSSFGPANDQCYVLDMAAGCEYFFGSCFFVQ